MDFGISGKALAPSAQPRVNSANNARKTPVKRTAASRPDTAAEVAVGSGLMGSGLDDVGLENQCRLQYARWIDLQEYVSANGEPDYWPSGLIRSTKKKGDDCKFYWKKLPEWKHFWGKASTSA